MYKIITQVKAFIKETDKILFFLCLLMSAFGILMVESTTKNTISDGGILSRDALVMILAVAVGIIAALIISVIDYNFIVRLWPLISLVCIVLMVLTFLIGVGPDARSDAKTWIALGNTGLYFQPSELVKIGFIITFSAHIDLVHDNLNSIKNILLLCVHGAIPVILVIVSGDMGSALIFMIIFVVMLFTAGVHLRYFFAGIALTGAAVPIAWKYVLTDIQKNRIYALTNPDEYTDIIYQQQQGLKAISSGGFFGSGIFKGSYTQAGLVPESENDMIFSVIGEELGLVGCIAVLVMFTLIIARIIKTGKGARDTTVTLICSGIAAMIAAQVVINIGMCLKFLPVIGITLPFLSAGGSSNLCIYIAVGLILSLKRYTMEKDIVNLRVRNINSSFE